MEWLRKFKKQAVETNRETLPDLNKGKVLVFGSRISGALDMAEGLENCLEQHNVKNIDIVVERNASRIGKLFKSLKATIRGVVLLNEMRQYDPLTGRGMTLDTFNCGLDKTVERLCDKNGIPLVELKGDVTQEQIAEKIKKLPYKS